MTTYLNGVIYSGPVNSTLPSGMGTSDVSAIARAAQGSFYFAGIVANLKLWLSANRDPSSLRIDMPLDESGAEKLIRNKVTPVGLNLFNGYDKGYLNANSTQTFLSGLGGAARTTKWVSISGFDEVFVSRINSTRGVCQFSSDGGATAGESFFQPSSNVPIPLGATHFRIYYGHPTNIDPYVDIRGITAAMVYAERINQPAEVTELYQLNTSTTPDQWESTESVTVIPITGAS
jgi:hypothetical protein